MKKLISFLLVIMLLSSISVSAFAEVTKVGVSAPTPTFDPNAGTGNTEVYLQVEAGGQIDAVVPLILVFRTDIDGGSADSPAAYQIINKTTAGLAVVKIETQQANDDIAKMVAKDVTPKLDQYNAVLNVDTDILGTGATAKNNWDLSVAAVEATKESGGLFKVKAKDLAIGADTTDISEPTDLTVTMNTGEFSFVTPHNDDDTINPAMGVKVLTVTYTLAVDGSNVKGTDTVPTVEWSNP